MCNNNHYDAMNQSDNYFSAVAPAKSQHSLASLGSKSLEPLPRALSQLGGSNTSSSITSPFSSLALNASPRGVVPGGSATSLSGSFATSRNRSAPLTSNNS